MFVNFALSKFDITTVTKEVRYEKIFIVISISDDMDIYCQ